MKNNNNLELAISKFNITDIETTDVEDILMIGEECNLSVWSAEGLSLEIKREDFYGSVIKQNETALGFLHARLVAKSEMDILNFGVLKKYQKCGFGSMLLNRLLQLASKNSIEAIWLEVRESNLNAVKFYRDKGFLPVQTRKNFYTSPPDNALLMKLVCEKATIAFDPKLDSTDDPALISVS